MQPAPLATQQWHRRCSPSAAPSNLAAGGCSHPCRHSSAVGWPGPGRSSSSSSSSLRLYNTHLPGMSVLLHMPSCSSCRCAAGALCSTDATFSFAAFGPHSTGFNSLVHPPLTQFHLPWLSQSLRYRCASAHDCSTHGPIVNAYPAQLMVPIGYLTFKPCNAGSQTPMLQKDLPLRGSAQKTSAKLPPTYVHQECGHRAGCPTTSSYSKAASHSLSSPDLRRPGCCWSSPEANGAGPRAPGLCGGCSGCAGGGPAVRTHPVGLACHVCKALQGAKVAGRMSSKVTTSSAGRRCCWWATLLSTSSPRLLLRRAGGWCVAALCAAQTCVCRLFLLCSCPCCTGC